MSQRTRGVTRGIPRQIRVSAYSGPRLASSRLRTAGSTCVQLTPNRLHKLRREQRHPQHPALSPRLTLSRFIRHPSGKSATGLAHPDYVNNHGNLIRLSRKHATLKRLVRRHWGERHDTEVDYHRRRHRRRRAQCTGACPDGDQPLACDGRRQQRGHRQDRLGLQRDPVRLQGHAGLQGHLPRDAERRHRRLPRRPGSGHHAGLRRRHRRDDGRRRRDQAGRRGDDRSRPRLRPEPVPARNRRLLLRRPTARC